MKRVVCSTVAGLALLWSATPGVARAFHSDQVFAQDASAGGGGGLYYNGSPRHKRYTCGTCHLDAERKVSLRLTSDPPELLTQQTYEPEAVYRITVFMADEHRGIGTSANYNMISAETVADDSNEATGTFFGFDTTQLRLTPDNGTLFSRSIPDVTEWSFQWRAPVAGTGGVVLYLAGVDGNGADSPTGNLTDPLGDDYAVGALPLGEAGGAPPPDIPDIGRIEKGCSAGAAGAGLGWLALALLTLLALLAWRRAAC